MGGGGGVEDDEVAAVVPLVVDAGEQVLEVEGLVVGDAELLEVEVDPAGLLVVGVEVDNDEDGVGRGWRRRRSFDSALLHPSERASPGTPIARSAQDDKHLGNWAQGWRGLTWSRR